VPSLPEMMLVDPQAAIFEPQWRLALIKCGRPTRLGPGELFLPGPAIRDGRFDFAGKPFCRFNGRLPVCLPPKPPRSRARHPHLRHSRPKACTRAVRTANGFKSQSIPTAFPRSIPHCPERLIGDLL